MSVKIFFIFQNAHESWSARTCASACVCVCPYVRTGVLGYLPECPHCFHHYHLLQTKTMVVVVVIVVVVVAIVVVNDDGGLVVVLVVVVDSHDTWQ